MPFHLKGLTSVIKTSKSIKFFYKSRSFPFPPFPSLPEPSFIFPTLSSSSFMASDLEARAKEAFIDDHFELSVELYTQAIALSPKKAELYIDRAQANIKLGHYTGIFFICLSDFMFPSDVSY